MNKKKSITDKDKKDWDNFLKNPTEVLDKEEIQKENISKEKKFKFDFHGYSIENANKKITEIITKCYNQSFSEILIITGKGKHSGKEDSVYVSKNYNKLQYSIPEFIKNNSDLNSKIEKTFHPEKKLGGEGAIIIKLKKLQDKF